MPISDKNKSHHLHEGPFYKIMPQGDTYALESMVIRKSKIVIGRSVNTDYRIPVPQVSGLHAIIEITPNGVIHVYDLSSKNGTYFNDERVESATLNLGETIRFADVNLKLEKYIKGDTGIYQLDALNPDKTSLLFPHLEALGKTPPEIPEEAVAGPAKEGPPPKPAEIGEEFDASKGVYALALDPLADQNPYIFEGPENVLRIFNYPANQEKSLEVVALHDDQILDIQYFSQDENKKIYLTPKAKKKYFSNVITLPSKNLKKKQLLAIIKDSEIQLNKVIDFPLGNFRDGQYQQLSENQITVHENDYFKIDINRFKVFLRLVDSAPTIDPPPFFERDSRLFKFIGFFLLLAILTTVPLYFVHVEHEEEQQKNLDKIAELMEMSVPSDRHEPSKVYEVTAYVEPAPAAQEKVVDQVEVASQDEAPPVPDQKAPQAQVIEKVVSKSTQKKSTQKSTAEKVAKVKVPAAPPRKSKKAIQKEALDSLALLDGVGATKINVGKNKLAKVGDVERSGAHSGVNQNVKIRNVAGGRPGKLSNTLGGKGLSDATDASGLVNKNSFATATKYIEKSVVVGSIDPSLIKKIISEHIPNFRGCYNMELRRSPDASQGRFYLNFTIGKTGHVSKSHVTGKSYSQTFKNCVKRVLNGMRFPAPKGGGIVEVKQPLNFSTGE